MKYYESHNLCQFQPVYSQLLPAASLYAAIHTVSRCCISPEESDWKKLTMKAHLPVHTKDSLGPREPEVYRRVNVEHINHASSSDLGLLFFCGGGGFPPMCCQWFFFLIQVIVIIENLEIVEHDSLLLLRFVLKCFYVVALELKTTLLPFPNGIATSLHFLMTFEYWGSGCDQDTSLRFNSQQMAPFSYRRKTKDPYCIGKKALV